MELLTTITLIASPGKEIYNIADPTICGKRITLAKSDNQENWAERAETVEPNIESMDVVTRAIEAQTTPAPINQTANNTPKKTKIQCLFKRILKLA